MMEASDRGLTRRHAVIAALALPLAAVAQQTYPSRSVTVIVPFPPGGSTDLSTRVIADRLSQTLGQPFVVHNRPGAAGNIGMTQLAKAEPDGYTLGHGYLGTVSIQPVLEGGKLPFTPEHDLTPVAPMASVPLFLVAPPSLGVRSLAELVAMAKAKPGQLTYGTAGNGSAQHVFAEAFRRAAGIDIRPIPFAGSGPANVALLGGHIDLMFDAGQVMQQVRAGQLVGLGMTGAKRLPSAQEIPAIAESYPGFEAVSWHGIFAPAGTPKPVVEL
ncbi:MAG TPA: tripartite tricarboxylate transporter substrate binding protein, partial [Ramlibacter sp.]|nr:tripartite tricarboxylate transporter substrate binding protein [Ramlibacter sp.]